MRSDACPICKSYFWFPLKVTGVTFGAGGQHGEGHWGTGHQDFVDGGTNYRELEFCSKCGYIRVKELG